MSEHLTRPWTQFYDPELPEHFDYPDKTMYQLVMEQLAEDPEAVVMQFQNTSITAEVMEAQVNRAAAALHHKGFRKGDVATIVLPNTPHAPTLFYAVQRLGGICSMVHPLTPGQGVQEIMARTGSAWLMTLDGFLPRLAEAIEAMHREGRLKHVVACAIGDYLKGIEKLGFFVLKGRKIPAVPGAMHYISWRVLQDLGAKVEHEASYTALEVPTDPHAAAVYLQSGGTTGEPKAIQLSAYNMNALAVQGPSLINALEPKGMKMLSILPFFHGFGLCMQMHTMFVNGIIAVLVPQFNPEDFANVLMKQRTEFLVGVPTLFEGLLSARNLVGADLSFIRAVFCGGDTLSPELKKRIDAFLRTHGATVEVREGYGLTETVTVCTLNPRGDNRPGSVGVPLADMEMCAVAPDTTEPLPPGEDGELCVTGPTVMLGYLDAEAETQEVLREHADGKIWVHTGDWGNVDADGYVYYKQRLKRIIKVSGIAVFPAEIEALLEAMPEVRQAAVIGVPHPYKIEIPFAYVVLKDGVEGSEALVERLQASLGESVLRHAVPKGIRFIDALPLTRMGKINTLELRARYDAEEAQG